MVLRSGTSDRAGRASGGSILGGASGSPYAWRVHNLHRSVEHVRRAAVTTRRGVAVARRGRG